MEEKIAAVSSVNDGLTKPPETETTFPRQLESLPSVLNKKKVIQEEGRLLGNIANRGEESMAFQTKDLEMLAPLNATQSTAYLR